MADNSPLAELPRVGRWRPRFSLRAMLVLVTGLCIWLGLAYSSAKRQERAVAAIEMSGGRVGYDWQHNSATGQPLMSPTPPGPTWLRKLLGPHYFDTVVSVDLIHTSTRSSPDRFAKFGEHLAQLPALKHLTLFNLKLSDAEFVTVGRLRGLEQLSLVKMEIAENGGRQIARLSNLRELSFHDDIVSAGALTSIKDMPRLEQLSVYCRHEDYRSDGFPIRNLEKYAIRDDALASLPSLTRLKTLSLTFTQITDDGVAILGRMPQLKTLGLSSPQITNASMNHLTKLQNLEWLGISVCKMDIDGVARLAELPKLTRLRISGPAIGNDCLPLIAKLHNLKTLDLGGKTIDDNGLHHLHEMTNLTMLDVQSTAVQTDGSAIREFKKALPNCRVHQYYPSFR